ncbi:hypothetical protein F4561_000775 [Lipingzhangella halophila]|uniref:DUF397 domain-containing protein n=1 Tax=Lipingzhangella halophila TaxID=1783352 RepID=A0A7W7W1R9_9ACTN|nr:DUF397 domain-containing protein [Lipingzhangella halophila]MBB4929955.1 hypothetical protein [Lipingzhangella halophila]
MAEPEAIRPRWRKSSYSGTSGGQCVEVAEVPGAIWVRDSTAPSGVVLRFPPASWAAFVTAATRTPL